MRPDAFRCSQVHLVERVRLTGGRLEAPFPNDTLCLADSAGFPAWEIDLHKIYVLRPLS